MSRNALRSAGARALAVLALLSCGGLSSAAAALPLIAEVFYDAVGSDDGQSFVELYGTPGLDLAGFTVEGINGANGAVTDSVMLSGLIPLDGFFVVADDRGDGTTLVANADLILDFDFQNGPDSVLLRFGSDAIDALGYGVFGPGDVFAGEGAAAPDAPAGSSLARLFANADTGDNATDFAVLAAPTPGAGAIVVPEPGAASLVLGGLIGLGRAARRSRD